MVGKKIKEKNKMKKTIMSCLISVFLIASVLGMDNKENAFEAPHANNYAQSNDFGDLNQLLIGSQIKPIDAHVSTKKGSNISGTIHTPQRIADDNNSECFLLFCACCCNVFYRFSTMV